MYKKLIVIILSAALASCGGNKEADKKQQLEELRKEQATLQQQIEALEKEVGPSGAEGANTGGKVELVAVSEPKKGEFSHFVEVQGRVDSDQNVNISAKVPGTVTKVNVQRGDKVTKGQVLAQLDDMAVAQGMEELRNQLNLATTVYQRQKNLWDQKIGSEMQFLTAKNNKESLEKKMATMREQIEMYRVRAPFNGTVDEVNTKLGETVAPGFPLFTVVNFSQTKVLADVSENYANKVKAGDEVVVNFPDMDKEIKSKIRVASQVINQTNRTFTIEIALDPKDMMLRPNMIAIVKIKDYTNKNVITLPLNVVQRDDKETFVYTAMQEGDNWVAKKKIVKTGNNYAGEVEILSGLDSTEKIITTGYQNVTDGQRVAISNKNESNGNGQQQLRSNN